MPLDLEVHRDLARILDDAFAVYRANWARLTAAAAAVVVPVQLAILGIGLGWLWSGYKGSLDRGEQLVIVAAQFLVVMPLVTAMAIQVLVGEAAQRRPGLTATIMPSLEAFPALFMATVLVAAGVVAGVWVAVAPGLFFAVRWALVPQAVVIDHLTLGTALRRSWHLVRGRGWWTFAVLVVVNLLAAVVSTALIEGADQLAQAVHAEAPLLGAVIVAQVLTMPLLGLAVTFLYFALRAGPRVPQPAALGEPPPSAPRAEDKPVTRPQPPPEDDAWERRRREGWRPPGP